MRDLHFYHAHVFIHLQAVYRHVHSLHHRNTDIEPFSGVLLLLLLLFLLLLLSCVCVCEARFVVSA